jgi:hypothetical protein
VSLFDFSNYFFSPIRLHIFNILIEIFPMTITMLNSKIWIKSYNLPKFSGILSSFLPQCHMAPFYTFHPTWHGRGVYHATPYTHTYRTSKKCSRRDQNPSIGVLPLQTTLQTPRVESDSITLTDMTILVI